MNRLKTRLKNGGCVFGGWTMIGSPAAVEIMAEEGFDFVVVDLEHTPSEIESVHRAALAAKGTGCAILARLSGHNPEQAKRALDAGASGIIVPSVKSAAEARAAAAMARFPPDGIRGASLCRAAGYGRRFDEYIESHNRDVVVVVMIEHGEAARQAGDILAAPGLDAALIGPYDLSASMGRPGQLDHPDVVAARQSILDACRRCSVPAGLHVVQPDPDELRRRIAEGYRFLACGIDTLFIRDGSRQMLDAAGAAGGMAP